MGTLRVILSKEVGPKRKNRRTTLRKKLDQMEARVASLRLRKDATDEEGRSGEDLDAEKHLRWCRACGRPYVECPGACWGFWKDPSKQTCAGDHVQHINTTAGGG